MGETEEGLQCVYVSLDRGKALYFKLTRRHWTNVLAEDGETKQPYYYYDTSTTALVRLGRDEQLIYLRIII